MDIDDEVLTEMLRITGDKNKSPAVARAVTGFVHRNQAREFGRMIREGVLDYPAPAADLAGLDPANPVPPLLSRLSRHGACGFIRLDRVTPPEW